MKKEPKIRIDCVAGGYLVNRYLAFCHETIFNTKGTIEENIPISTRGYYKIQWENIRRDIAWFGSGSFNPDLAYNPYFWQRGAIGFDAAAQTSHSGEPATITWSHTIGSNTNRIICIMVSGLATPNAPKWDANATTAIVQQDQLRAGYYLAPVTGSANCTADGGNIKVGGSISFDGVDQTTPIGATTTENGGSSPNDMTLTTDTNNSFRVDACRPNNEFSTNPTASLDSGTLRCNDIVPQNQFRIGLFAYTNYQATAGADTHQWTFSNATNIDFIAYEVHEAAAAAAELANWKSMTGIGF